MINVVNHYRDGIQVILDNFDYSKIIDDYGLHEVQTLQKRRGMLPLSTTEATQKVISRELTDKIKRLTQKETALLNMKTDVVYYICHLEECHGEYITTISTDSQAHISLEVTDCYVSFISDEIKHCMHDTISHELRHHYDRDMVNLYDQIMDNENDGERPVEFSVFFLDYLFSVRTEGFASFEMKTRYHSFMDDHYALHQNNAGFLDAAREQWTPDIFSEEESELIDTVLDTYDFSSFPHIHPGTPYEVGKTIMDTIAFSRTKQRKAISPSLYSEVLEEVRGMDLFEFYVAYYGALEKLSIPYGTALVDSSYLDMLCDNEE